MEKPKIIAIVGPTASGKSALGVYLAQKLDGEVISADSRQVYRGLNIGTGKITKKEMQGVPHHLLDVASPKKQFSADEFVRLGKRKIENVDVPIVVGGTGFYIDALLGRLTLPNVPPNKKLRAGLEKKSVATLYKTLQKLDPRRAKTVEPKHKRRIIRALEIAKTLGRSPLPQEREEYTTLWLGLSPSPQKLKKSIHTRLLLRMRLGMVAEAKRLHKGGLSYKRMEELGLEYRYLARLLQKQITYQEFETQLEREIQRYAKRQARWFKRNKNIHWLKNKTEALQLAKRFLLR